MLVALEFASKAVEVVAARGALPAPEFASMALVEEQTALEPEHSLKEAAAEVADRRALQHLMRSKHP